MSPSPPPRADHSLDFLPEVPGAVHRSRGIVRLSLSLLLLGSIVGLSAWYATRPDPLGPARLSFARGEIRVALRSASDYRKRHPDDPSAALLMAQCLSRLGLVERAEESYRLAGTMERDDLHDRAMGLTRLNRPEEAARVFTEIIGRWPDDPLALQRLVAVRMGQRRWDEALRHAERLAQVPSTAVNGSTLVGMIHHEANRADRAVIAFRRVLELDPELRTMPLPPPLFWDHLALDLIAEGKSAEARAFLLRALARRDDAGLMELVGLTHQLEGEDAEAERCWTKAVEWDPSNGDAWLGLGRLALRRRRAEEAIRFLRRAAEASPRSDEPFYNLSQAHRLLGDESEADRLLATAELLRQGPASRPGAASRRGPSR